MNKFEMFMPLMFPHEYKFIEKFLSKDDVLLEWGSGNGTIYFSGLVNKVVSIEHDEKWVNQIKKVIDAYNIENIEIHNVPAHSPNPIPCRYEQFRDYIEYPKKNNIKFTKILIDGRARKYCAKSIYEKTNKNTVIFIHDFNRSDYKKVLKYYNIIEEVVEGKGIVALKKKNKIKEDDNYY